MPLLSEYYEIGTSDRVQHRHKSGAQTSVSMKKIGLREAVRLSNIEGNMFERVFYHYEGMFIEGWDKNMPRVDEKYLIELRLD